MSVDDTTLKRSSCKDEFTASLQEILIKHIYNIIISILIIFYEIQFKTYTKPTLLG